MIEHQYSRSVAAAQEGSVNESIHGRIRAALLENSFPAPLRNLGLRYRVVDDVLCADLHGFRVRIQCDHVWLKDAHRVARLGGRMRFIDVTVDGKDGVELLQLVFDHVANARIGNEAGIFRVRVTTRKSWLLLSVRQALRYRTQFIREWLSSNKPRGVARVSSLEETLYA